VPLAAVVALAALGCGIGIFALASRSDDRHEAMQRELLGGVFETYRAGFADYALSRAAELSAGLPKTLPGPASAFLVSRDSRRHLDHRAYLLDGGGQVIASHPEGEMGPGLRRLVADIGGDADRRRRAAGAAAKDERRPVVSDVVWVEDELSLAAAAGVPVAAGTAFGATASGAGHVLVLVTPLGRKLAKDLGEASGVSGLGVQANAADAGGSARAFIDRHGRILGWFAWNAERPMSRAVVPFLAILGFVASCVILFALLSARLAGRSQREFAETVRRAGALANEDALTGLANRRRMLEFLDGALASRASGSVVTFAFVDLDNFKDVNDAHGHHGGDQLLAAVGERIQAALPEGALAGRFGGDEFALILTSDDTDAALRVIKGAVDAVSRPFWMNGQVVQLGATVGIAHAPSDGATRDDLIRRADLALRGAMKGWGGRICAFAPAMEAELEDRRFLKQELRRALGDGALDLHYQPIVNAEGTKICGVEALLRWNHPTRGAIPPNMFVPIAEQTGLMEALGEFVLRKALTDALRWPNLYIAINVSPVEIRSPGFVELITGVMTEVGIAPSRVVVEVTEGVLIDQPDEAQQRLEQLHALGVRLALDDFGVGYSSLSYLQRFPFDKLKIDKGFVAPLGRSANGGVIIQSIVGLGCALGLSVLAEGVETEEQRVLLRLAGCNEMQGFLFARPAARETIDELVAKVDARGQLGHSAVSRAKAGVG
jgi:diguanylate cyclase (GGDEF)-like protein